jgi:Flp pilus assembly protein protease CpaA
MTWITVSWVLTGLIVAGLFVAVVTDLSFRIIPNRLVMILFCVSLALRLVAGPRPPWWSVAGGLAILAGLGAVAQYGLLGWGDAKLIAAVSFAVPADRLIAMLLAIALAGGALGCVYLAARFALRRAPNRPDPKVSAARRPGAIGRLLRRERKRILANEPMPYALAIFGGVAFGLSAR